MYWNQEHEDMCEQYVKAIRDNDKKMQCKLYKQLHPLIERIVRNTYFTKQEEHFNTCINDCFLAIDKKPDNNHTNYFGYITVTAMNFWRNSYINKFKDLQTYEDMGIFNLKINDEEVIDLNDVFERFNDIRFKFGICNAKGIKYENLNIKQRNVDKFLFYLEEFLLKYEYKDLKSLIEYVIDKMELTKANTYRYTKTIFGKGMAYTQADTKGSDSDDYINDDFTPDNSMRNGEYRIKYIRKIKNRKFKTE
jgi:hypothetical protein